VISLSVKQVREALAHAAGPDGAGAGEPSTLVLGRIFHEMFADLVSVDPARSGLRVIAESGAEAKRRDEQLIEHAWQRLLAPRLRRSAAGLHESSAEVLTMWKATKHLTGWLSKLVGELVEHRPDLRGNWEKIAPLLQAEVPLHCELREPGWKEPVHLTGFADSVLRVPGRDAFCAIELKLGRAMPAVDLGQATLYYLMLARTARGGEGDTRRSCLALLRFSPMLEEHVVEAGTLGDAVERLLNLIGRLAGVVSTDESKARNGQPPAPQPRQATQPPDTGTDKYLELGKRLTRAYREHGVGVEVVGAPRVGPRFLRFEVRLATGMKLDGLERRTREVQLRLEFPAEPLLVQDGGRLYVDVARPDPEQVLFSAIASSLPPVDDKRGSSRVVIGVDPARQVRFADLASSGRCHILAAGIPGSGKSEWLRMMLASLVASNTPETLRIVTFDPKLTAFQDLEKSQFLWKKDACWPASDHRPASDLFDDLIEEMETRYQLLRQSGADDLRSYVDKTGRPLPRIICVCDEYADLVSQNKKEKAAIEERVRRLGAKARAAGIHLVLATQQPSRQTVSGAIQTNLPCRVALTLASPIESNMILGTTGAERLTGSGDLLYKDLGDPVRLQAPYLPEADRRRLFQG
jgi:hypothetical protein